MKSDDEHKDPTSPQNGPLSSLPGSLRLTLHAGGDEKVCRSMEEWLKKLQEETGGKLSYTRADPEGEPHLPCVSLSFFGSSKIRYHFVPKGTEDPPFKELLWKLAARGEPPEGQPEGREDEPDSASLLLFVSNQCPNCPRTVRVLHTLCGNVPFLSLDIFEATQDPGLAGQYDIKSVPTLIVEETLRFVGDVEPDRLVELLRARNTPAFLHERIRQAIREGQAEQAALLLAKEADPSFLAEDLGRSTFQERIGLLLALEEALEIDPRCLDPMVQGLLPHLEAEEPAIRGDVADLLGKIGHPHAIPALETLSDDPNPDVAEAAEEALDVLRRKQH